MNDSIEKFVNNIAAGLEWRRARLLPVLIRAQGRTAALPDPDFSMRKSDKNIDVDGIIDKTGADFDDDGETLTSRSLKAAFRFNDLWQFMHDMDLNYARTWTDAAADPDSTTTPAMRMLVSGRHRVITGRVARIGCTKGHVIVEKAQVVNATAWRPNKDNNNNDDDAPPARAVIGELRMATWFVDAGGSAGTVLGANWSITEMAELLTAAHVMAVGHENGKHSNNDSHVPADPPALLSYSWEEVKPSH